MTSTTDRTADIREFLNAHLFSGVRVNLTVMAVSGFSINVIDSFTPQEFTIGETRFVVAVPARALPPDGQPAAGTHAEERFPIHLHLDISKIASAFVEPRPNHVNVPKSHKITFLDQTHAKLFWVYTADPPRFPTTTATFRFETPVP